MKWNRIKDSFDKKRIKKTWLIKKNAYACRRQQSDLGIMQLNMKNLLTGK
jgi:hypothetical protein